MNTFIKLRHIWQHYGWYESTMLVLFTFLQKAFNLDRQEVVLLEPTDLSDKKIALSANFSGGFIDYKTLRIQSADDPELEMNEDFLNEAIKKQDLCYAICKDGRIVSYGWYSRTPTKMKDGLYFHFDNQYVYMYKGMTKPEFRGERLHAAGMTAAMKSPQLRNTRGMVSYVERQNLASLRSVYRMGSRRTGSIYSLGIFDNYYNYSTPGCKLTKACAKRRDHPAHIKAIDVKV